MAPQFTRPGAHVGEGSISETCLPMRGSEHPAFVEMLFSWAGPHDTDPRYRSVTLPKGMALVATDDSERYEIHDKHGYPRALITLPGAYGPVPTIRPVRRFAALAEKVAKGWRMAVSDWTKVVTRGETFADERKALASAEAWLDQYRGGWRGYSSAINFSSKPPKWNLSG